MIDLYRRLGASGPADVSQVARAMADETVDPELRRLAAFILASPHRRRIHDDTWRTVSVVARLRASLLLDMSPLWRDAGVADFGPGAADPMRMRQCLPIDGGRESQGTDWT
jgi:hypothetical protein